MTHTYSFEPFGAQPPDFRYNPQYPPMPAAAPGVPVSMPPPPPVRPNRTPIIVLACLLAVSLAASGTMLVRYLDERGVNVTLSQQRDDLQRALTDANQKLAAANAQTDQLNSHIDNLNGQVSTLTTNNTSLNNCVTAFKTWVLAFDANPGASNLVALAHNADSVCGF